MGILKKKNPKWNKNRNGGKGEMEKKQVRREKGITLVALVITIIVLIILAGVAIMTLTGEEGILSKTILSHMRDILRLMVKQGSD